MSISVRFFASVREQVGRGELTLDFAEPVSMADIWQQATGLERPQNLLVAVNQEYVDWQTAAADGDEVAFFPPVTGG